MAPTLEPQTTPVLHRPGFRRRVVSVSYWAAIVALLGVNAFWVVRDLQPPVELKTIADSVRQKRYHEAEVALRNRLRRSPHDEEALILLARTKIEQGDTLAGARLLHSVPIWWPAKPDQLYNEGQAYLSIDRAREGEAAWAQCVHEDPLHPLSPQSRPLSQSVMGLLKIYTFERRLDEARALIRRVYDRANPSDREDILRIRIETEVLAESQAMNAERLRHYLRADPEDWQARRALAVAAQTLGNGEEALKLIDACLKARPDDVLVRRDLLSILRDQGKQERFRAELARLPASADLNGAIWKYRGIAREQDEDRKGAADAYRRAVELGEGDKEVYYRLGIMEQRLGRPERAAQHIKHSQRLSNAILKLYPAFWKYLDSNKPEKYTPAARAEAIERLASVCADLDWTREAEAWKQLLLKP